ncbi:MAG: FecR domain-containing protein [Calditrichaeota bacterium]|nr:FecR domain-containing protein [Calditrichota bacterium]
MPKYFINMLNRIRSALLTKVTLVGLWVLLANGNLFADGDKSIALTLKVNGNVQLKKAGTDRQIPLKFGTPLDDGDWVRTGADGFATIIFTDDKSQIKLTANTEVTVEGKRDDQANIAKRVSMEVGQVFAKVSQQRGALQIATPTSVASVKGTEFWVIVFDDGTTQVVTLEGLVELLNTQSGRIVEVRPGQRGEANRQGGVDVQNVPPDQQRGDPDPGMAPPSDIEIEIQDPDGRTRRIIIRYQEGE